MSQSGSIQLAAGYAIRYRYKGEWEYAIWRGDGTRTVVSLSDLKSGRFGRIYSAVFQGVWKRDTFEPHSLVTI